MRFGFKALALLFAASAKTSTPLGGAGKAACLGVDKGGVIKGDLGCMLGESIGEGSGLCLFGDLLIG